MSRLRSIPLPLPLLAMVDAFVSGVSVILVMVIVSTPQSEATGNTPRTNIVLSCNSETITLLDVNDVSREPLDVEGDSLILALTNAAPQEALAQGVRIEALASDFFCANEIEAILQAANTELDLDPSSAARPVFVTHLVFKEDEDEP